MKDSGRIPWPRVQEYLFRLSSTQTSSELLHVAGVEIQNLIPFDSAAGVFNTIHGIYLDGIGMSDAVNAAYNSYYRTRQPLYLESNERMDMATALSVHLWDWTTCTQTEYATDFMIPNGMCKSLAYVLPGHSITITIQRSRMSPGFSEWEIDTLGIVNAYLNDLYSRRAGKRRAADPLLSAHEIAEKFPRLSPREAEVCAHVALRLNRSEISTCLCISPRTVEKHIESIFDKLDIRSREQLRWRLGVFSPPGPYSL